MKSIIRNMIMKHFWVKMQKLLINWPQRRVAEDSGLVIFCSSSWLVYLIFCLYYWIIIECKNCQAEITYFKRNYAYKSIIILLRVEVLPSQKHLWHSNIAEYDKRSLSYPFLTYPVPQLDKSCYLLKIYWLLVLDWRHRCKKW